MASLEPIIRPRLRHGLLANFAGSGWSALMQLVCVPLYVKFMGVESYGLIGFYLVFQAMTQVLDLGLSPTLNREMARYSVQPEKAAEARDLLSPQCLQRLRRGWLRGGFTAQACLSIAFDKQSC
jgi:hypothetical protein